MAESSGLGLSQENLGKHIKNYIQKFQKLPNYKKLKMSKSSFYRAVEVLKTKNEIIKISGFVWKLNKIVATPTTALSGKFLMRGHNYQVTCRVKNEYWKFLEIYLKKKSISYEKTKNSAIKIKIDGWIYHIFKSSIVLYHPVGQNYISSEGELCDNLALAESRKRFDALKNYLGIDFRHKGDYLQLITRKHLAWVNSEFAIKIHSRGDKIQLYYKNKLYVITDRSFNWDELEFVDTKEANRDHKIVFEPFFNTLRDNPEILKSMQERQNQLEKLLEKQLRITELLADQKTKEDSIRRWSM